MEEFIITVISDIAKKKKDNNKVPVHALDIEIQKEMHKRIKDKMREMWRDNKLIVGTTINHLTFYVNKTICNP
ncbi:MAG: hypothetical protein N4A49_01915 [Marinifilaceae bacterium]|jgi:hypothetical protein|nr:hypothetical protein [Marinifilaceae bacterium]